jgi:N utilization substance protein A
MQSQVATPSVNLNMILDQVAKDKGIERTVLVDTLEQAIKQAAQKTFGMERNIEATFNVDKGVVELFQAIQIVPEVEDPFNQISVAEAAQRGIEAGAGDELLFQIYYREEDAEEARVQDERHGDILKLKTYRRGFGRIAAQTAKQVIIQRVRDAEREIVYNEYKDRKGEIVTGIARRFERGNIVVDLGRAEAVLPVREQVPRESYRAGDRVQAYVLDVLRESKGPQIILSRASVSLLTKLFEMEVPEIAEAIVVIEAAAREPGGRAKIAVASRDHDVDPVGACVGMKGSRVQAVVQELRGEKIDIVPFDDDPARFVCSALQPAEVSRVVIDEANHAMEISCAAHRLEARHQQREPGEGAARFRQPIARGAAGDDRAAHRAPLQPRFPPGEGRARGQHRGPHPARGRHQGAGRGLAASGGESVGDRRARARQAGRRARGGPDGRSSPAPRRA